jgi:phosphoenolpyruvate---glycerone phosphotransferase subunit DhaL
MAAMTLEYADFTRWIRSFADVIAEEREHLTKLDSAIGDADHGSNMHRGFQASVAKIGDGAGDDIGAMLKTVGMTLVSKVGGAGGPLYGTLFMQMGAPLAGKSSIGPDEWAAALESGIKGLQNRGKAEPEDKTMLDALLPALNALKEALQENASMQDALERSADAAEEGMKATVPLVARKGRASYLGERSAGHQDPGATSAFLLVRAAADTWGSSANKDGA